MGAFRIKTFLEVTASMIGHVRAVNTSLTDFIVGSVNRTMLEAPAAEIDELYQAYANGLVESIPVAIYRSFDFDLQPAKAASGVVRLFARPGHNAPVSVPAGYLVASGAAQYQTVEAVTIPVGTDRIDVLAVCTTPGPAGNAAPDSIKFPVTAGYSIVGVTNPLPFANGRGTETEAERKLRFVDYVRTLAKGTVAACKYAAKQAAIVDAATGIVTERVGRCEVDEERGHVDLYIHNGAGNTSEALRARAAALVEGYIEASGLEVEGYRPTGMRVDVLRMAEIPVPVDMQVEVAPEARSDALRARVAAVVSAAIIATPNRGTLFPLTLLNAALAVPGVRGASIAAPSLTITCPVYAVLVPGTVVVGWR